MLPGVMTAPPPPAPAETARVPDNIWLTAPLPEVQAGQQTLTTDWTLPNDTFSECEQPRCQIELRTPPLSMGATS